MRLENIDTVGRNGVQFAPSDRHGDACAGAGAQRVRGYAGRAAGVSAPVDKDLAAEKLAELVRADMFVSVTAVPNAYINYGKPEQLALGMLSVKEVEKYIEAGHFGAGSMLPKIQAITQFARKKKVGIIASPDNLELALARRAGTIVQ